MVNLIAYVGAWIILATLVLVLALYRIFVGLGSDNYVHISQGEARLIPHQVSVNRKIMTIDRMGEVLTVATLLAGLGLACLYVYQMLWR
jgi:hypothetical protein